jgi:hypothetical protein
LRQRAADAGIAFMYGGNTEKREPISMLNYEYTGLYTNFAELEKYIPSRGNNE